MKKKILLITQFMVILLSFLLFFTNNTKASVNDIPYKTYSIGLKGKLVETAPAYEGTFILNDNFKNPEDIYIDFEDNVYIADSGNKRIYKYNPYTKQSYEIGQDILENPVGVFVDRHLDIYVADAKLNKVLWFNQNGELQKTYDKPDEPLFGKDSSYKPRKVLVDARKNVYIISESGANGIIQMDRNGDFLGYYGVNKVNLNFSLYFKRLLMSEEQKEKYASLIPKPNSNFAIDQKGLIYTVIENEYITPIKKLNIEGNNVLSGRFWNDPFFKDIFVGNDGMIYTVSNNPNAKANISVHDNQGNLIFLFGERAPGSFKIGEFDNPVGIATDGNGDIWVLDSTGGYVQVFTKTEFGNLVMQSINQFNSSKYDRAEELFQEVVRQNAMFSLAHSSLGKIYQRNDDIDRALEHYKIANDKEGYSDVYWELRDEWIADYLLYVIVILTVFYLAWRLFKKYRGKLKIYNLFNKNVKVIKQKKLSKELRLLTRILRNPFDVIYDIKFRQVVRIRTAIGLYVVFVFINIISNFYLKGYLFRVVTDDVVLSYEIMKWTIPLLLFGVANHLINSLQNGEGFYQDIFIGIIYATAPILLFKVPIDIVSNVLTYNEAFIFRLGYLIIQGWTIINVVIVIKEINNYKVSQLIINLVLTLFTMLIMIILYLVINVLTTQMITFIQGIMQEVF